MHRWRRAAPDRAAGGTGRRPGLAGWTPRCDRGRAPSPARARPALPRRRPARCGRRDRCPATPGWTADEAARALLLAALPPTEPLATEVEALYRYGDAAEKRAVLRALPLLPIGDGGGAAAARRAAHQRHPAGRRRARARTPRAPDRRTPGGRRCSSACSCGVPLAAVADLDDAGRRRTGRACSPRFAAERHAAGRAVPADAAGAARTGSPPRGGADAHLRPAHPHDVAHHRRLRARWPPPGSAPSSSRPSGSGSRAPAPARSPTTSTRCSAGSRSGPRSSASGTTARSR